MRWFLLCLPVAAGSAGAVTVAEARADLDGDGIPDLLGQTVVIEAVATCARSVPPGVGCLPQFSMLTSHAIQTRPAESAATLA